MKEYVTLKVSPENEGNAIQHQELFGWKLEDTREVYNESQEIVGINEKVTSYGSFMQGFTGNDGKIETQVETRTNVTHFLSMRFSRDNTIKNYSRFKALQDEFDSIEFLPYTPMPDKPILRTILGVLGFISIVLPLGAILSWILYSSKSKKAKHDNEIAAKENELRQKHMEAILAEAQKLQDENATA